MEMSEFCMNETINQKTKCRRMIFIEWAKISKARAFFSLHIHISEVARFLKFNQKETFIYDP